MTAPARSPSHWREIARGPFALIEFEGECRLFRNPKGIVTTRSSAHLPAALEQLRDTDAVGFIGYEAGHALERAIVHASPPKPTEPPLLWFLTGCESEVAPPLPDPAGAWAGQPMPLIARADYLVAVERIREYILNGDIYQANLTFPADVEVQGHPLALYAQLRKRAGASWGAVLFTGEHWILSFSPELFFTAKGARVTARPMKGTAPPDSSPGALRDDPKQRAENLMIVDLLRNDLSRFAKTGTVKVPELFVVETYPTVLQMTSTVTAQLEEGVGPVDLLGGIFPCGSVTGAPKIRAMQIIAEQETVPRGVYTGSIGMLTKGGDGAFNVAIRTMVLPVGSGTARLGLGSGVVADSVPESEWEECKRKAMFVGTEPSFGLIETMRIVSGGVPDLDLHLNRMERSATAFGFTFDPAAARSQVLAPAQEHGSGRLRLELRHDGRTEIALSPLPDIPEQVDIALAQCSTSNEDFRRHHKTTDRAFYDDPRAESGAFEVLFVDEDGYLTEGSFTNIFVESDGRLLTPPSSRGLLPGILRQRLLASGEAVEADLRVRDLAGGFLIGNALRGLIRARLREPAYA
ncbi:MAG: aminodeoxychorismate synthase component I [Sphingomicrobium sp.]